jgi:hypothetical protein
MRLTLWKAPKGYENALAPVLIEGARLHGDEITIKPTDEYRGPEGDGGIIFGVVKREILWDHAHKGVPLIYLDKGYKRARAPWRGTNLPTHWRMCWNATHPTEYLMRLAAPADRWDSLGLRLNNRNAVGTRVVILGSSAKFHHTEKLVHPTEWTQGLVREIQQIAPDRKILYRPKPSWSDAQPVDGARFDHGGKSLILDALRTAFCSITYGSIACVDSVCAGVPCIVLGNGVAAPISSRTLGEIADPMWQNRRNREQWAANLAYCHFTPDEIASGFAWKTLKEQMRHAV